MTDVSEIKSAGACSFDDLERAALAALDACQRAFDSGDSAVAERWADEFGRLGAALWSEVVQLPLLSVP
jgi:hypothetical protein